MKRATAVAMLGATALLAASSPARAADAEGPAPAPAGSEAGPAPPPFPPGVWSPPVLDSIGSGTFAPRTRDPARTTALHPAPYAPPAPTEGALGGTPARPEPSGRAPDANRPRGLHHQLWFVSIELFVIQTASLAVFAAMPREVTGFDKPNVGNIMLNAVQGPHLDNDRWGFNYVGHPLAGSEYYLLARNRRSPWWHGFLYSAGWSAYWEYVSEGLYERASIQDLIVTPVAGSALGELRYQARRAIVDPKTGKAPNVPLQILAVLLDPVQSLADAWPLAIGRAGAPDRGVAPGQGYAGGPASSGSAERARCTANRSSRRSSTSCQSRSGSTSP